MSNRDDVSDLAPEFATWLREIGLSEFVSVGLETTGLDPELDRIIEIGAVRFENGKATASFQSLVNPEKSLDPYVTDLTGISDVMLRKSPPFSSIVEDLAAFAEGRPLIMHSSEFQFAFLRVADRQAVQNEHLNALLSSRIWVLDPAFVARVFWPELPNFSLSTLAMHFDIPFAKRRRALEDASTSGSLLIEMMRRVPARVWHELARDLHRLIGSTTHRSRFFFAALNKLAKDIPKPTAVTIAREEVDDAGTLSAEAAELLGKHGQFERKLSYFTARPSQIEMARAIDEAFEQDEILLVDAPTGVGKSLAYLVPALHWCLSDSEDNRQVIISSHTRVLQEQLQRKDIGDIRVALDRPFRSAVLKGRTNYLCKRRLKSLVRDAAERLSEFDRIQLMPLLRWSEVTPTGDISEIGAFNPRSNPQLWSQVCSDSLACAGGICGSAKGDFHRLAQERAGAAHLLFINHALLFSDPTRLTAASADTRRFVLDEAHQIEKAAVSAMTVETGPSAYRNVLGQVVEERANRGLVPAMLRTHREKLPDRIRELAEGILDSGRALYASIRRQFSLLAERVVAAEPDASRVLRIRLNFGDGWHRESTRTLDSIHVEWLEFAGEFNQLLDSVSDLTGADRLPTDLLGEFRSAADNIFKLSDRMDRFLHDEDSNIVRWIEAGRADYAPWSTVSMAPVSVGGMLRSGFWPSVGSAVLTSATLASGSDFSLVRSSLGLDDVEGHKVRELSVDSPFDLDRQMRMLVPMFLPDPRGSDLDFVRELASLAAGVIESNRRATVILCTSNDMLERLTAALSPVALRAGRPLFSQAKSSSTPELLAAYRSHRDGVLIGAATFWEGIDLVGDALEILIVSKIPFDVPVDPWIAARCDALQADGHDSFAEFTVPSATLRLKQGIGRLIRHPDDRGVAILADPRLFTSRYGQYIRRALPGTVQICRTQEDLLTAVSGFFDGVAND